MHATKLRSYVIKIARKKRFKNTAESFQKNVGDKEAISGRFILISSGIQRISLHSSPRHLRREFRFVIPFVTAWGVLGQDILIVLFKGDIVGKLVLTNTFPTNPFDYPSDGCWRMRDYLWAKKNRGFPSFFPTEASKRKVYWVHSRGAVLTSTGSPIWVSVVNSPSESCPTTYLDDLNMHG